jgi:uncharacterized protein (DUF4415 family)
MPDKPKPPSRGGRPRKPEGKHKQSVTLRLDPDLIEHFRSTGAGWQTLINETLRRAVMRTAKGGGTPR